MILLHEKVMVGACSVAVIMQGCMAYCLVMTWCMVADHLLQHDNLHQNNLHQNKDGGLAHAGYPLFTMHEPVICLVTGIGQIIPAWTCRAAVLRCCQIVWPARFASKHHAGCSSIIPCPWCAALCRWPCIPWHSQGVAGPPGCCWWAAAGLPKLHTH